MQSAIDYLERTKATFLNTTAGLTEEQWHFRPAPGSWSIAECAEHLAVIEDHILRLLQAMPGEPPASNEDLAQIRGKDEIIVKMVPARSRKQISPTERLPANRWPAPELPARFVSVRDRIIALASPADGALYNRVTSHFALGPLTGYQWLLFVGAHSERHLKQMEEVKADPAYPRIG